MGGDSTHWGLQWEYPRHINVNLTLFNETHNIDNYTGG